MSYKTGYKIPGFYEYVVPPLEGFWVQPGTESFDYSDKSALHWTSVIRLPDFVGEEDFSWAMEAAERMDAYIAENGYENDMGGDRRHHEIYLSDPRKTSPEKWKTVIRHPIRRK